MSSLLQNVLASRLAQASINGESSANASERSKNGDMGPPLTSASAATTQQGLEDWESVEEASIASDEELVGEYAAREVDSL